MRLGESIWIQGPGQQGLAAVIAAKAAGAGCIIVSGLGHDKRRLEVAKLLGADYTIDVDQDSDPVARILDWTGGDGVNVVVNVTGGGKGCVQRGAAARLDPTSLHQCRLVGALLRCFAILRAGVQIRRVGCVQ